MRDHRLKFARGKHLYGELRRLLSNPDEAIRHRLSPSVDPTRGVVVVRASYLDVPALWSHLAGETLHNLRSSLDALAFTFSVQNSGRLSQDEERQVGFPVCDSAERFEKQADKQLARVPPVVREAIERLQPYHASTFAFGSPLRALVDLNNIDKHRRLLLVASSIHDGFVSLALCGEPTVPILNIPVRPGFAEHGEVVAEVPLPVDVDPKDLIVLQSGLGLNIVIRDYCANSLPNVQALFDSILVWIEHVAFPRLEPLLE